MRPHTLRTLAAIAGGILSAVLFWAFVVVLFSC
jgi:hypothetical protein